VRKATVKGIEKALSKSPKFDRKRPVIYKKPYVVANLHVMYDVSEKAKE